MDSQVKAYIGSVRDSDVPMTTFIVLAVGMAVIHKFDADLWQKTMVLCFLLQTGLNSFTL